MDEIVWVVAPGEGAALREVVFHGGVPDTGQLARALAGCAVTVYLEAVDGAWITPAVARELADLARASEHNLDLRVVATGGLARPPEPLVLLDEVGLAPALALREPGAAAATVRLALLARLRAFGLRRPRLIVVPPDGPVELRFPSSLEGGVACAL